MILAGTFLVVLLAFAVALCDAASTGDQQMLVEYPELERLYRAEDAPRCICGEVLRIEDWRFDRCPQCRGRLRERKHGRGRRQVCR